MPVENTVAKERASVRIHRDPRDVAAEWRARAEAENLTTRELIIEMTGFILVPHITPGGLDAFADKVVPILQEKCVYRTEYEGETLRDHLGLARPVA